VIPSVLSANKLNLSFNRNLNATGATLVIEASTDLAGSWTAVAQKVGTAPWSVASGFILSDGNTGPGTDPDAFSTTDGTKRFLRLNVSKP